MLKGSTRIVDGLVSEIFGIKVADKHTDTDRHVNWL